MKHCFFTFFLISVASFGLKAQNALPKNEEDFKQEVLQMRQDIDRIQLNLYKSHNRFKIGLATATIGYTVTIAGGLLLANSEVKSGRILLVTGGIVGVTGTFLLVDAFRYLEKAAGPKYEKHSPN